MNTNYRRAAAVAIVSLIGLTSCAGTDGASSAQSNSGGNPISQIDSADTGGNYAITSDELPAATAPENSSTAATTVDAEDGQYGAETTIDRTKDNTFEDYGYRQFVSTVDDPLSTFAADVDTGSYSIARRWLDEGTVPPPESVRPEEYINALHYDYEAPERGLGVVVDGGSSPFNADNKLVRIGIQGEVVAEDDRLPVALTFVIDTSGSMSGDNRLELVKDSLEILVDGLKPDDTVAIVTYDDESGVILDPTPVKSRREIIRAIDRLETGGSTNLEAGLQEAYSLARNAFREGGINRVILASDGVANQGVVDPEQLVQEIQDDADNGINLVTVGFGMGNYNDTTMEQLADKGDGFYAYVDTIDEARHLFADQLTSTLVTIAKDAKIQVEFNPETVAAYRLIGFENRGVADRDFENDAVDAGELGSGHQVTAIYELQMVNGMEGPDPVGDLGTVRVRWADPDTGEVSETDVPLPADSTAGGYSDADIDYQVAVVAATFAELTRENPLAGDANWNNLVEDADRVASLADREDVDGLRDMIDRAAELN